MATTLEELERRITRTEQELARLQRLEEQPCHTEMPAQRGMQLLHEAQWRIFLCGKVGIIRHACLVTRGSDVEVQRE